MPKLEPKDIQNELKQGFVWPVYWIFGLESMKIRELHKRIQDSFLGPAPTGIGAGVERLDGAQLSVAELIDRVSAIPLGGGRRLLVVSDAGQIKGLEEIDPLLKPRHSLNELDTVLVLISKDLDQRKKSTKLLLEKTAVVSCEEVPESDRISWIRYLCQRRDSLIPEGIEQALALLDPWSLDIVDSELEKLSLNKDSEAEFKNSGELSFQSLGGANGFIDSFFNRRLRESIDRLQSFAPHPEESIPLLGLMAWNLRQIAAVIADEKRGTSTVKLNPYIAGRLKTWTRHWKSDEIQSLQKQLSTIDYGLKQTPLHPLGLWSEMVQRFCH